MTSSRSKTGHWAIDPRLRAWHPVLPAAALRRKPVGLTCCGVPVAIFRDSDNAIRALYDRCAHRRFPLSAGRVTAHGLTCPYHGYTYGPDGSATCPHSGAPDYRVPVFETQVIRGIIWIRAPDADDLPGAADPAALLADDGFRFSGYVHKSIAAPLQLVVDNMSELEHTGSVHNTLAFGISGIDKVENTARIVDDGVVIYYSGPQRPLPFYLSLVGSIRAGDIYTQTARVEFQPPHAVYDIHWTRNGRVRPFFLRFVIFYTEIDPENTSLFAFVSWKAEGGLRRTVIGLFNSIFRRVVGYELELDKRVIERLPERDGRIDSFKLNRFDRPLVLTRRILAARYARAHAEAPPAAAQPGDVA